MFTAKGTVERKRVAQGAAQGPLIRITADTETNPRRFTATATVERSPAKGDVGARYTFKYLGVSDTLAGTEKWAVEWLQRWLDENF